MTSFATPADLLNAMGPDHAARMEPGVSQADLLGKLQVRLNRATARVRAGMAAAGYTDLTTDDPGDKEELKRLCIEGALAAMAPAQASSMSSMGQPTGEAEDRLEKALKAYLGAPGADGWGRPCRTAFEASLSIPRSTGWK